MRKSKSELTSNQYYAGLNRRFDKRMRLLAFMGYDMRRNEHNCYTKQLQENWHGRIASINASFIMHADKRAFLDELYTQQRRTGVVFTRTFCIGLNT